MPIKSVRCPFCSHSTTSLSLLRQHQQRAHLREFRSDANREAVQLAKQTGVMEPPKVSARQERVNSKLINPDHEVPSSPQADPEKGANAIDASDAVSSISRMSLAQQQDRLRADSYRGAGAYSKTVAKTTPESWVANNERERRLNESIARREGAEATWKELQAGKPHAEIRRRTSRRKHDAIMKHIKQKVRESGGG